MIDPAMLKYLETGGVFAILVVVLWFYRRDAVAWKETVKQLLERAEKREDGLTMTLTANTEALSRLSAVLDGNSRATSEYQLAMHASTNTLLATVARIEGKRDRSKHMEDG